MQIQLAITLDHAESVSILNAARQPMPVIPPGKNTVCSLFTTDTGERAIVINQTGFAPRASDNEEQVNGCTVAILKTPLEEIAATNALLEWAENLLELQTGSLQ